jgi:hypothetical protein
MALDPSISAVVKRTQSILTALAQDSAVALYKPLFGDHGMDYEGIHCAGGSATMVFPFTPTAAVASPFRGPSGKLVLDGGAVITLVDTLSSLHAMAVSGKANSVSADLFLTSVRPVFIGDQYNLVSTIVLEGSMLTSVVIHIVPVEASKACPSGPSDFQGACMIFSHTKCMIPMSKTEIGIMIAKL